MTFEWEDITGKVLFAAYRADDMVTAITEGGQEYLFEFDAHDTLENQQEILELFLGESADVEELNTGSGDLRETEKWLTKWLPFVHIFVRKDFSDRFFSEFDKQSIKRYLTALDTARKLLNPQSRLPRMVIQQQRQYGKWEAFTFDQQHIKEVDEILKKAEREVFENKEKLLEKSISPDEFKAHLEAKFNEVKETEEPIILTFEWEDITDEILNKVVYVEFKRGDTLLPCFVTAITEDGREYFAESNELDKEDDIRELFLGDNLSLDDRFAIPENRKNFRAMGKWIYKRVYMHKSALQIFVRKDLFDRFISVYEERNEDLYSALNAARKLLTPQELPRKIHSQTLAIWDREES